MYVPSYLLEFIYQHELLTEMETWKITDDSQNSFESWIFIHRSIHDACMKNLVVQRCIETKFLIA